MWQEDVKVIGQKTLRISCIFCFFSVFNKKEKDPALKVVSKNVSVAKVDIYTVNRF